jgi:peptidoglycan L-alanyl-D-glutamate endopeptidase CwlK
VQKSVQTPDRDFENLYPVFADRVQAALKMLNTYLYKDGEPKFAGIAKAALFEGYRSLERQAWLYAQGRTRKGPIVTYTKIPGYHGYGLAADVAFKTLGGQWTWKAPEAAWELYGHCVRAVGLAWAGNWEKYPETPHCQPRNHDYKLWKPAAAAYLDRRGLSHP